MINSNCPFCGYDHVTLFATYGAGKIAVQCNQCYAEGPLKKTEQEAIEAWDNRHTNAEASL